MSLDGILKTVIDNLHSGGLEREEDIKMAAILPILHSMDWNPADPGSFRVEYPAGPGRVDYALLCHGRPQVLIEAKRRGALDARAEAQLYGYAANNGVPLPVLTDGCCWDFYLSMADGLPEDRRVHRLELRDKDRTAEYAETLEAWLCKRRVASGEARRSAECRLENHRRRIRAREAMPEAWRALLKEPDELLCDLLADKVRDNIGVAPQRSEIEKFLLRLPPVSAPSPPAVRPRARRPEHPAGREPQGKTAETRESKSENDEPSRGGMATGAEGGNSLQDIVKDLMRTVLEESPETLDEETIDRLETARNPLGLKIGNHTLLRKVSDGRMVGGHGRYWTRPYAGKWYVCSQWSKQDHRHNARTLGAWVESLITDVDEPAARDCLLEIVDRLSNLGE